MYSACVAHISSTCSAGMNMGALFWQAACVQPVWLVPDARSGECHGALRLAMQLLHKCSYEAHGQQHILLI